MPQEKCLILPRTNCRLVGQVLPIKKRFSGNSRAIYPSFPRAPGNNNIFHSKVVPEELPASKRQKTDCQVTSLSQRPRLFDVVISPATSSSRDSCDQNDVLDALSIAQVLADIHEDKNDLTNPAGGTRSL